MRFTSLPCQLLSLLLLGSGCAALAEAEPASGETEQSSASAQRATLDERSKLNALALEARVDEAEQQRLDAAGTEFLALWRVANAPKAKGVVVLLPDDDESIDAPLIVGSLRRKLPDNGWSSLSLSLPDPLGALLPPRSSKPAKSDDNTATPIKEAPSSPAKTPEAPRTAYVQGLFARIDAAIAFAEKQAEPVALLGHGSGAYWAAHYIAEREPAKAKLLLLVDSRQPESFSVEISELLPQIKAKVADFYYQDKGADQQAALQRKQVSQRLEQLDFTQVAMQALPGNPELASEQLLRRLRGWLDKHATAPSGN